MIIKIEHNTDFPFISDVYVDGTKISNYASYFKIEHTHKNGVIWSINNETNKISVLRKIKMLWYSIKRNIKR